MLPVMAIVCAVAASFASVKWIATQDEGEFIQLEGQCQSVEVGCSGDGPACTIPGQEVYRLRDGTVCEELLQHTPQP